MLCSSILQQLNNFCWVLNIISVYNTQSNALVGLQSTNLPHSPRSWLGLFWLGLFLVWPDNTSSFVLTTRETQRGRLAYLLAGGHSTQTKQFTACLIHTDFCHYCTFWLLYYFLHLIVFCLVFSIRDVFDVKVQHSHALPLVLETADQLHLVPKTKELKATLTIANQIQILRIKKKNIKGNWCIRLRLLPDSVRLVYGYEISWISKWPVVFYLWIWNSLF